MEFEFAKPDRELNWKLKGSGIYGITIQKTSTCNGSLGNKLFCQCARPINPQTSRLLKLPDTVLSSHYSKFVLKSLPLVKKIAIVVI